MTSSALFDIGTLVESSPGVYGGQPCLAGTRFPILQLAADYQAGMSPEEIAAAYDGLDLARVYAGMAYYFAKRVVDAELERRRTENQAALAEHLTRVSVFR